MKTSSNVVSPKLRRQASAADACGVNVVHLDAVRRARACLPPAGAVYLYTQLLSLLANPTRLRILLALQATPRSRTPELCVCDLAAVTGASKSMTSHQLRLLRMAGLVVQRRAGKLAFYRLVNRSLSELLRSVSGVATQNVASKVKALIRA